jgi:hypothetical protein
MPHIRPLRTDTLSIRRISSGSVSGERRDAAKTLRRESLSGPKRRSKIIPIGSLQIGSISSFIGLGKMVSVRNLEAPSESCRLILFIFSG